MKRMFGTTGAMALLAILVVSGTASATIIDFESQPAGPSLFALAGPAQSLNIGGVQIDGGVILTNTANLPADQTNVYGTASFGDATLTNPLTITFSSNISNFFLDVFNGLTTDISYRVSDNIGNSAVFTLAPNLSGGKTQIGFAAAGSIVTIASITPPTSTFDFFIDNIHFNEPLPPNLVPEPGSIFLLGTGLFALAGLTRKLRA